MEKRIIPVLFFNQKLKTLFSEIIEKRQIFDSFELIIINEEELNGFETEILILDEETYMKFSISLKDIQNIFLIKSSNSNQFSSESSNIVIVETPITLRNFFKQISKSLEQDKLQKSRKLNFKRFSYDPSMRTLSDETSSMRLTEKESQIFMCLIDNSNTQISKKNLLKKVWSYNEDIDTHTLETHIYSLRKKIEKNLMLKDLIIFLDNKGYYLNKKIL